MNEDWYLKENPDDGKPVCLNADEARSIAAKTAEKAKDLLLIKVDKKIRADAEHINGNRSAVIDLAGSSDLAIQLCCNELKKLGYTVTQSTTYSRTIVTVKW